jgi:non-specific serine/threonine protein kinase/NIMA (never in mitosis gene a)-related kinase
MQDYERVKLLGQGSFGKAFLVRHRQSRELLCAKMVKVSCASAKERKAIKLEVELMKKLDHPNIVRYHDSFLTARRAHLCIMMEYCDGGDLEGHIKRSRGRITESKALALFVQVALGLNYLHQHRVLHRDLKPQNCFLLGNGRVVLGDFGISKVLEGTLDMARTKIGTPYYMSPQVFRDKPYGAENDIWALGCVLFELLTTRLAFEAQSMAQLMKKIESGKYNQAALDQVKNKECKDLIRAMLTVDQRKRPSSKAVLLSPLIRRHLERYMTDVHRRARDKRTAARKPVGAGTMQIDAALQRVVEGGSGGEYGDGLVKQLEELGLQGVVETALECDKDLQIANKVGGFQTLDKEKRAKVAREQLHLLQREDQTRKMLEAELERRQEELAEVHVEEEEEEDDEEEQPIVVNEGAEKQKEQPVATEQDQEGPPQMTPTPKSAAELAAVRDAAAKREKNDERQQQRQQLEKRQHQLLLAQQKEQKDKQKQKQQQQKQKQQQEHQQQQQKMRQRAQQARVAKQGQAKVVQARRGSHQEPMYRPNAGRGGGQKDLPAHLMALMDNYKPGEQQQQQQQEQQQQQQQQQPRSRPSVSDLRARSPAIAPLQEETSAGNVKDGADAQRVKAGVLKGGAGKSKRKLSQPVRFSNKLEQRREQQWKRNQDALRRKLGFQIDEEKQLVMQAGLQDKEGDEDEIRTMGQKAALAEMRFRQKQLQSQVTSASQRCEDIRARLMESKVVVDRQALYGEKLDALLQQQESD